MPVVVPGRLSPESLTSTAGGVTEPYGALVTADGNGSSVYGQYVWKDLKGIYQVESGGSAPTSKLFVGSSIDAYAFGSGDAADYLFHMPHDWAVGTDLHIHVHWGHSGTGISGTMLWTLEVAYADRQASAPFSSFSTTAANPTITNSATVNITNYPQYCHVVEEIQLSAASPATNQLDTDDIAVDGLILVHIEATTIPSISGAAVGSANEPFLFFVDLHYQADIYGTKNKDPNFYT